MHAVDSADMRVLHAGDADAEHLARLRLLPEPDAMSLASKLSLWRRLGKVWPWMAIAFAAGSLAMLWAMRGCG